MFKGKRVPPKVHTAFSLLSSYFEGSHYIILCVCSLIMLMQEFPANTDATTPVTTQFPSSVYAQIVRITCMSKSNNGPWRMRFDILGCLQTESAVPLSSGMADDESTASHAWNDTGNVSCFCYLKSFH